MNIKLIIDSYSKFAPPRGIFGGGGGVGADAAHLASIADRVYQARAPVDGYGGEGLGLGWSWWKPFQSNVNYWPQILAGYRAVVLRIAQTSYNFSRA